MNVANARSIFSVLTDTVLGAADEALDNTVPELLDTNATLVDPEVLGAVEPPAQREDFFRIESEPLPDILSGDGHNVPASKGPLCLGELLDLHFSTAPLYMKSSSGASIIEEGEQFRIRQGFLGNCPLIACLVAMAHVPHHRRQLERMISVEPRRVQSFRRPAPYEHCVSGPPPPTPAQLGSTGLYVVRFRRPLTPSAHVERPPFLGQVVRGTTVYVSGALYFDHTVTPEQLHYAHMVDDSNAQAPHVHPLWPAIIEKAYAVARGNNSYEGINNYLYPEHLAMYERCLEEMREDCFLPKGFDPLDVLEDVAGPSRAWSLQGLSDTQAMTILRRHEKRPTVVDTKDSLPEDGTPPPNHALAIVDAHGDRASTFRVTTLNAIDGMRHELSLKGLRQIVDSVFQTR